MTKEKLMIIAIVAMAICIVFLSIHRIRRAFKEIMVAKRATLYVFQKTNEECDTEFFIKLDCENSFFNNLKPGNNITQIQVVFKPQNKHRL